MVAITPRALFVWPSQAAVSRQVAKAKIEPDPSSRESALMRVENNTARQFCEVVPKLCRAIPAMRKLFPTPQGFSNFGKGLLG